MKIHLQKEIENFIKTKKDKIVQEKLQGELVSQLQNSFQNVMEDEGVTKEMQNILAPVMKSAHSPPGGKESGNCSRAVEQGLAATSDDRGTDGQP